MSLMIPNNANYKQLPTILIKCLMLFIILSFILLNCCCLGFSNFVIVSVSVPSKLYQTTKTTIIRTSATTYSKILKTKQQRLLRMEQSLSSLPLSSSSQNTFMTKSRRTIDGDHHHHVDVDNINNDDDDVVSKSLFLGKIKRIRIEGEDDGFLNAMSVPTFASFSVNKKTNDKDDGDNNVHEENIILQCHNDLENIIKQGPAFVLDNVLSKDICNDIINCCENANVKTTRTGNTIDTDTTTFNTRNIGIAGATSSDSDDNQQYNNNNDNINNKHDLSSSTSSYLSSLSLSLSSLSSPPSRLKSSSLFKNYNNAGKNNHGALQILVSEHVTNYVSDIIRPFINISQVEELMYEMDKIQKLQSSSSNTATDSINVNNDNNEKKKKLIYSGLNRRWRIYRYRPAATTNNNNEAGETFAPHIDAGFPPSGLSNDNQTLIWDITTTANDNNNFNNDEIIESTARLTLLIYLNDDFMGGETNFYSPLASSSSSSSSTTTTEEDLKQQKKSTIPQIIASIRPKAGSILIFPQAIGENAVEYARTYWSQHEGSSVYHNHHHEKQHHKQRPKYVIRSDVIFDTILV